MLTGGLPVAALLDRVRELSLVAEREEIPHIVGRAYEDLTSRGTRAGYLRRKIQGAVFTPHGTARLLVERVISGDPPSTTLDPACGGGVFLIETFEALMRSSCFRSDPASAFVGRIYGIDRDPGAVEVSRLAMRVALRLRGAAVTPELDAALRSQIVAGDTLFGALPAGIEKFSCIIGNPPFGLSREERLTPEENRLLKQRFADSRRGKLNKYLAFIARSLELLDERGRLMFIVPNSFLGIENAEAVRRNLLSRQEIREIVRLDRHAFPEAKVEVAALVIDRKRKNPVITLIDHANVDSGRRSTVHAAHCLSNPGSAIPIGFSEEAVTLASEMARRAIRLEDSGLFRPRIALQAYAVGKGDPPQTHTDVRKRAFDRVARESKNTFPYLNGGDVRRYAINWSGSYLSYGPWLAEPQRIEYFSLPRILLREILGAGQHRIAAAFVEEIYLYNKSVLHILPRNGSGRTELLALLAILNSSIGSFLISVRGRKSDRRLFPKLVNRDLLDLPIPINFTESADALGAFAVRRLAARGDDERDALERNIEEYVAKLYAVGKEEWGIIERALSLNKGEAPVRLN